MVLATLKFNMPFEPGELVQKKIYDFSYKEKYDKYYVLDVRDYLSRGEVIEAAVKNIYLICTKQTTDISLRSEQVLYHNVPSQPSLVQPPEFFGTFLGNIIPILTLLPSGNLRESKMSDLLDISRNLSNEFYEPMVSFWMKFIPGPHPKFKGRVKPIWVLISKADMFPLWKNIYEEMKRTHGIASVPLLEDLMNKKAEFEVWYR